MKETGAVKFCYESEACLPGPFSGFEELRLAREELRCMGLLGADADGIGFGNVSVREGDCFYITGSGTGLFTSLQPGDCVRVTAWDFERNWLRSEGLAIPSAESLTHAAIYESDPAISVVLHGHDNELWRNLLARGPSTAAGVTYGTPAMAREVKRLFRETDVGKRKLFAMAGHEAGIVAFGANFSEALGLLRQGQG